MITPVDQTTIGQLSKVDEPTALKAVAAAHQQHREWADVPLADRKARVTAAVDAMTDARHVSEKTGAKHGGIWR